MPALGTVGIWSRDVAERVRAHLDAGADHVCLRVVTNAPERLPRAEWRALAGAAFTVA